MAGLLNASMEAPVVDIHDVPDHPYFVNQPVSDDEEEEPEITPIRKPEVQSKAAERPIVSFKPITPTYRPAFIPPKPAKPATETVETPEIDLSSIVSGSKVTHKAFGVGIVNRIENGPTGQTYIHVLFGKTERHFGFPGAFYDGYLKTKD